MNGIVTATGSSEESGMMRREAHRVRGRDGGNEETDAEWKQMKCLTVERTKHLLAETAGCGMWDSESTLS